MSVEMGTRTINQIESHYNNTRNAKHYIARWTDRDMKKFEEAYKLYGKNYAKIRDHIETKSIE